MAELAPLMRHEPEYPSQARGCQSKLDVPLAIRGNTM